MGDPNLPQFPGRVRQFAADHPGHAVALAVGAAWTERQRGGRALAVAPTARRTDPLVVEALALAERLGLDNLHLVEAIDPKVPLADLGPRERQPIHLQHRHGALDADAVAEPFLFLPGRDPRWRIDAASLLALAWISGDGRRVAWELPRETPLRLWQRELAVIGHTQLALKLLVSDNDVPWPAQESGLDHWWVASAAGAEYASLMRWALDGEEPVVLGHVSQAMVGTLTDDAWLPGAPRLLANGGPVTVVCCAAHAGIALAAATATGAAALQLTGIHPTPLPHLRRAAANGPLIVLGEDLARHLAPLAVLDATLHATLAPCDVTAAIAEIRSVIAVIRGR